MRSLVIYHSRYGNTERIARAVAEGLGERGEARAVALADLRPEELQRANLVVLGAPTQFRGIPIAMWRFLRRTSRETWFGRPVAVFDTRYHGEPAGTGSAAAVLAGRLQRVDALLVAPPQSFFVSAGTGPLDEGELTRAEIWGRQLHLGDRVPAEVE